MRGGEGLLRGCQQGRQSSRSRSGRGPLGLCRAAQMAGIGGSAGERSQGSSTVRRTCSPRLVTGIDKASAALALAVLIASGLVVFDATFATTRARRRDIGIVSALGWRARDIALGLLAPVLAAALAADSWRPDRLPHHQALGLPSQPVTVWSPSPPPSSWPSWRRSAQPSRPPVPRRRCR